MIEFLSGIDCQLVEAVKPLKIDIAYLADIFTSMNEPFAVLFFLPFQSLQVQFFLFAFLGSFLCVDHAFETFFGQPLKFCHFFYCAFLTIFAICADFLDCADLCRYGFSRQNIFIRTYILQ